MPYTAEEFEQMAHQSFVAHGLSEPDFLASLERAFNLPYETEKLIFVHARSVRRIKRALGMHGRRLLRSSKARSAKRIKCMAAGFSYR